MIITKSNKANFINWILENKDKYSCRKDLFKGLNIYFNTTFTEYQLNHLLYDNKIRTNYLYNKKVVWTKEHIEWLKNNNIYTTHHEILDAFNTHFKTNYTIDQLKTARKNYGLKLNHNYNTNNSQYGAGRVKPILSERIERSRIQIKTPKGDWMSKSKYMYEQYHNEKVDTDEVVVHLDKNKNNFNIENLYKIKRHVYLHLTKRNWHYADADLTLTRIKWCELHEEIIRRYYESKN